jgi:hypothetical protein
MWAVTMKIAPAHGHDETRTVTRSCYAWPHDPTCGEMSRGGLIVTEAAGEFLSGVRSVDWLMCQGFTSSRVGEVVTAHSDGFSRPNRAANDMTPDHLTSDTHLPAVWCIVDAPQLRWSPTNLAG